MCVSVQVCSASPLWSMDIGDRKTMKTGKDDSIQFCSSAFSVFCSAHFHWLTNWLFLWMRMKKGRRTCEWMIPLAPHSLTHYFLLIELKVHTVTVCLHAFAARWLVSAGEKEKESWLDRDRSPKLLGSSRRSCSMTSSSFSSFSFADPFIFLSLARFLASISNLSCCSLIIDLH